MHGQHRFTGTLLALILPALVAGAQVSSKQKGSAPVQSPPGAIEGIVRLRPAASAASTVVENTTDPEVCGREHTMQDLVVSPTTGGVAHAIVALDNVSPEMIPDMKPKRLVLDNRGCRFVPHVAVLTVGDVIEARNGDPVLHTVHLYGAVEANLALPKKGKRIASRVESPGMIVVKCDVHGWMQAFVRVDAHPFHAVSERDGSFRIANVPPGDYAIGVWHEKLGSKEQSLTVRAGETGRVEFEYSLVAP